MKQQNQKLTHVKHEFDPIFDENSEILILGTLPSVKSREQNFYYGHPQNRFWKVMAAVLQVEVPISIDEKKRMLHENHIALWDTIYSCDIIGSSDSSIRNVTPTDLQPIIEQSQIKRVYCNGAISGKYFKKYQQNVLGMEAVTLPSTSPANAAYSVERLVSIWKQMLE